MKCGLCAVILLLFGIWIHAQEAAAPVRANSEVSTQTRHGTCAENDESVGYPLKGWVGITNTGEPVSDMTVQVLISPDKPPVAIAKTDAAGRFSFPRLGPGRFYLRATKKLVGVTISADDVVTVSKGTKRIACLVAEGEVAGEPSPR